jgi:hypothetical protein
MTPSYPSERPRASRSGSKPPPDLDPRPGLNRPRAFAGFCFFHETQPVRDETIFLLPRRHGETGLDYQGRNEMTGRMAA